MFYLKCMYTKRMFVMKFKNLHKMKKVFFGLVATGFIMLSSFTTVERNEVIINESKQIVDSSIDNLSEDEIVADCTMTIRDNKTGKSYTITVHGTSCGDLIKQLMQ